MPSWKHKPYYNTDANNAITWAKKKIKWFLESLEGTELVEAEFSYWHGNLAKWFHDMGIDLYWGYVKRGQAYGRTIKVLSDELSDKLFICLIEDVFMSNPGWFNGIRSDLIYKYLKGGDIIIIDVPLLKKYVAEHELEIYDIEVKDTSSRGYVVKISDLEKVPGLIRKININL